MSLSDLMILVWSVLLNLTSDLAVFVSASVAIALAVGLLRRFVPRGR